MPFGDRTGTRVVPTTPNAFKFERFIFDLMPLARRVTLVEIDPAVCTGCSVCAQLCRYEAIKPPLTDGKDA